MVWELKLIDKTGGGIICRLKLKQYDAKHRAVKRYHKSSDKEYRMNCQRNYFKATGHYFKAN